MYGLTSDAFEHRGQTFSWALSQNRLIYNVYHGTMQTGMERIGGVPTNRVRFRYDRRGLESLLPIVDAWLDAEEEKFHAEISKMQETLASDILSSRGYADIRSPWSPGPTFKKVTLSAEENEPLGPALPPVKPTPKKARAARRGGKRT